MIIKKIVQNIIIVISCLLCFSTISAQTDSLEVHHINGKEYYIHVIEKGNTLYSISKLYDTPIDVIKKENPSVLDGLSIGEKVFIPLKKNQETQGLPIDGNYILHNVEKGRTLYSLAKEYNIEQKDIIALNPEISDDGIKEGQVLKIPVKEIKKQVAPRVKEQQNFKTHHVQSGETLYSLSKLYKVSIDSIELLNNGLKEGLKVGETIYIPLIDQTRINTNLNTQSYTVSSIVDSLGLFFKTLDDSISKKPIYKIALMLPFYIEENQEIVENLNALDEKKIYPKSKFAVEFYHGVVLALDSLSNNETNFELNVYDTKGQDSLASKKILLNPEMKEMDLIIGPLYYSNFEAAAEFAKGHSIPIVTPVKQNNKILLGNPYVYKVVSSKSSIIKHIAQLAIDSFNNANLLAVEHNASKENQLADSYIKEYNHLLMNIKDTFIYSPIKKLSISSVDEIISQFKPEINNVVFIPSTNTTFVTNLFSALINTLNEKNYKDYQVTLIGLEEWSQYENIDLEYFQRLNVHLPTHQFVDYDNESNILMIKKYYDQTETYPSNYSFLGYDVAFYFGSLLKDRGANFHYTTIENQKGVSFNFNFLKTGIESGYENIHTTIVKYEDLLLKKVF